MGAMNIKVMKIILCREETMACILALQKEKPYGWRDDALRKLEKALGFNKPKGE